MIFDVKPRLSAQQNKIVRTGAGVDAWAFCPSDAGNVWNMIPILEIWSHMSFGPRVFFFLSMIFSRGFFIRRFHLWSLPQYLFGGDELIRTR